MSGYDTHLILHLHDGSHAEALEAATAAVAHLEAKGYTVTQRPTLPYAALATPEEFQEFMEGDQR